MLAGRGATPPLLLRALRAGLFRHNTQPRLVRGRRRLHQIPVARVGRVAAGVHQSPVELQRIEVRLNPEKRNWGVAMSNEQKICLNCKWFGRGDGGVGCGLFNIRPHAHSECKFQPNRFEQRDRPAHWVNGPAPAFWYLHGQKPKKSEVSFKTKSGKEVKFKKSKKGKKK